VRALGEERRVVVGGRTVEVDDVGVLVAEAVREALADVAIALVNGEDAETTGTTVDSSDDSEVPSILLEPQSITKDNVGDVIEDGGVKPEDVCSGDFAKMCADAGIS
jgi:ABC-type xylose transport system substrate-binding protein